LLRSAEENSYPLKIDGLTEITFGAFKGHMWAKPSVSHLRELMRRVVEHPEEALAKGSVARKDMVEKYSPAVVTKGMVARLRKLVADKRERRKQAAVSEAAVEAAGAAGVATPGSGKEEL